MASNEGEGNGDQRRSLRKKRVSEKAQSALDHGEQIPGVGVTPLFAASSPTTTPAQAGGSKATSQSRTDTTTQKSSADKMRTRKKEKSNRMPGPDLNTSPALSASSFMLSGWPQAPFKDRDELDAAWKRLDQATTGDIIESYGDGADDDWEEFAGNPDLYPQKGDLERAVSGTFVNRAKRACRQGRSWLQFEAEEEAINSMRQAMMETDPNKHEILKQECLNNDLRVHVFGQLKSLLASKIWDVKYVPRVANQVPREPSPLPRAKKDSKVSFEAGDMEENEELTEPDEFSVTGWVGGHAVWHSMPEPMADDHEPDLES